MRLEWTKGEDGTHVAPFDLDSGNGTVSFRTTHEPEIRQWRMYGRIRGIGRYVIELRQGVPDSYSVDQALEVFRRTCEYDVLVHLEEVRQAERKGYELD